MKSGKSPRKKRSSPAQPPKNPSQQPKVKMQRVRGVAISYPEQVKKSFNTTLTAYAIEILGELACANGISRSEVIERMIREKASPLPPVNSAK